MCPMYPRTGRPHLGQFLTLNKPSAPARNMISLAIQVRARTHIRRRKHIHIQTHTQCMRVCVRARIRAYGGVWHTLARSRANTTPSLSPHIPCSLSVLCLSPHHRTLSLAPHCCSIHSSCRSGRRDFEGAS